MVGALLAGTAEFRTRTFIATDSRGKLAGVVAVGRVCPDRWLAAPWLFDHGASPLVGGAIDTSRAVGVIGPQSHVLALEGHLSRKSFRQLLPFVAVRAKELEEASARRVGAGLALARVPGPTGLRLPPPDPRVRAAVPGDVAVLMELIGDVGWDFVPTRLRARRYLRGLVDRRRVLVAVVGERPVGLIWAEYRSQRWDFWGGLRVDVRAWRHGLSWPLAFEAMRASEEAGRTFCCVISPTNTMKPFGYFKSLSAVDDWCVMALRPRELFRGQNRLRAVVERLEGTRDNGLTPSHLAD